MGQTIASNVSEVRRRIREAAKRAGRDPAEITLIGVTKTQPVDKINAAIDLGIDHIGESRIQEARERLPDVKQGVTRHFIGHLQRNKVKYAVKLFDMIQSVDSILLAEELNARCSKVDRQMPILIEVNTSGEDAKMGCQPSEALTLLKAIDRLPNLSIRGFMSIALYSDDLEKVRPCFKLLREIFEDAKTQSLTNGSLSVLSMGMSSDFELAIEEGSTMVRVGTSIFGKRIVQGNGTGAGNQ